MLTVTVMTMQYAMYSGFVDSVMFSDNGVNGADSKMTLFHSVHQMEAPWANSAVPDYRVGLVCKETLKSVAAATFTPSNQQC